MTPRSTNEAWHIGVLGGSGLYQGIELDNQQEIEVSSPFGEPSGPVTTGTVGNVRLPNSDEATPDNPTGRRQ